MNTAVRTQNVPFLPPAWAEMLKRSLLFAAGIVVMLIAAAVALALLTYTATDPSLNTATRATPENALGYPGAVISDILLQATGLGAFVLVGALAGWAVRLMRAETVSWLWLRTIAVFAAMLLIAMAVDGLPTPDAWPTAAGFGGSAGHVLVDLIARYDRLLADLGPLADIVRVTTCVVAAIAGALAAAWAMTLQGHHVVLFAHGAGKMARGAFSFVSGSIAGLRSSTSRETKPRKPKLEVTNETAKNEPEDKPAARAALVAEEEEEALDSQHKEATIVAPRARTAKPSKREIAARQGSLLPDKKKGFDLPHLEILAAPSIVAASKAVSREALESNARMLESVLDDFGIKGQIVKVRPGPVVTLYELEPAPGTKTSRVISLADDIARSMSAVSVRIAVVPGRTVIGIELPNATRESVLLREMLSSDEFEKNDGKLVLSLGKDIGGEPVFADLARMPHLLVAGTTGSGKSVAINTMIMSLLYRNTPADVRFIMIDPKMLELSSYDGIPHLLAPVVTDPGKAVMALKWVVREMENRYRAMSQLSVRNVAGYNQRLQDAAKKGQALKRTVQTGFDPGTGKPIYEEQDLDLTPLPYIVVIIDEMADLMLVAGKEVEAAVQRLAQMARAAGIHVIMATQRPSVDVITGTIKANFPTRISFQVTSKIDSRTILGEQGAEQLLGQGDMLYMAAGGRITRVHGPFVSDREVEMVTQHLREQCEPDYVEAVTEEADMEDVPGFGGLAGGNTSSGDGLFDRAVAIVAKERKASTSFIQRHLQIGYNRAATIIEQMEQQGMISRANHVGKREVLLPPSQEF